MMLSQTNCTITGRVSNTPTTIQTSSVYNFTLNLQNILSAEAYFQFVFPSDFDFTAEGTSNVVKTCNQISGIRIVIGGDSMV